MNSVSQQAINSFLHTWKDRPEYDGTLLSGSLATGMATQESDIDLKILYRAGTNYREMGECVIDQQYISFIAMPAKDYEACFQSDLESITKFEILGLAVGQIIDDPNQQMAALQQKAIQLATQAIEGYQPVDVLHEKLKLNRQIKVLQEMSSNDLFYALAYSELLQAILTFYARSLQADIPGYIKKWERFFTQAAYRKASQLTTFPDEQFVQLFIQAARPMRIVAIKQLYDYVIEKTGRLPATNFMARFYSDKEEAGLFSLK